MSIRELSKELLVTCEILGQRLSDAAIEAMLSELSRHNEAHVIEALRICRKTLKQKLTLSDILDRLPCGHPGVEEAWAIMAKAVGNEAVTLVHTQQMIEAWAIANDLQGDMVAARMAFKETYTRLVDEARARNEAPAWTVSLGHDKFGREKPILDAVQKGRLTPASALRLLPEPSGDADEIIRKLVGDLSSTLSFPTPTEDQ